MSKVARPVNLTVSPNKSLVIYVLLLAGYGLYVLLSASSYDSERLSENRSPYTFILQQLASMVLAFGLGYIAMVMNYRLLRVLGWPLMIISLVALCMVDFTEYGRMVGGSERWLEVGWLRFQPSELTKLALLIFLADGFARHSWRDWQMLLRMLMCAMVIGLVLKQPDLGTSVILMCCCVFFYFIRGLNIFVLGIGLALCASVAYIVVLNNDYQLNRIEGWLHPEDHPTTLGWNLLQSYYAIGSGGLLGLGYGASIQKLGYLPISHADYIYAIICEELGIVGLILTVGAYLFLLWRGTTIALAVPGSFGRLLGLGIIFMLVTQAGINLCGVVGLLPMTGVTLPFISYGKTSVIVTGIMFGILLNLSRQRRIQPPNSLNEVPGISFPSGLS